MTKFLTFKTKSKNSETGETTVIDGFIDAQRVRGVSAYQYNGNINQILVNDGGHVPFTVDTAKALKARLKKLGYSFA